MRGIKFRAWDKKSKQIKTVDMLRLISNKTYQQIGLILNGEEEIKIPEELILMQYTELEDKNGKEIYEGDIVEYVDLHKKIYPYNFYEYLPNEIWLETKISVVEFGRGAFRLKKNGNVIHTHYKEVWENISNLAYDGLLKISLKDFIKEERERGKTFKRKLKNLKIIGNIYENPELLKNDA